MSTTNAAAYCEPDDVQEALQETDAQFSEHPFETANVEAAIFGVSSWLAKSINGHWYDSNADPSDLIDSSANTFTDIVKDVPSSPSPQQGQTMITRKSAGTDQKYPVTRAGRYVRVKLGVRYVDSVDKLEVRQRDGGVRDWVAESGIAEGKGEDYYLQRRGQNSYGTGYLYLDAAEIGPRYDFTDLLTIDVTHGLDWGDSPWNDVRRGVAALAGAQLVTEDDLITSIAEQGVVMGVETKAQQLVNQAFSEPGYLDAYMGAPVR